MSNVRSEFEKNVIHKQIIDRVRFREKTNQYLPIDALSGVARGCADVVNVGWISYQYQQYKIDELQKRLDAVKTLIEEYRDPPTEDKTFQHALSIVAYVLEQALKGGGE